MLLTFSLVTGLTFNQIRKTESDDRFNIFSDVWRHREDPTEQKVINLIQKYVSLRYYLNIFEIPK